MKCRGNQTQNPCPHGTYFQLGETPLHPVERKTQAWRLQSRSSSEPETTPAPPPGRTGSNHDMASEVLAEMCCGLSELITVPSYAGVSIQVQETCKRSWHLLHGRAHMQQAQNSETLKEESGRKLEELQAQVLLHLPR
ncbi:LOW QUALITY PROTEIN: talanin [Trichechus manatus latirostris]|uniref:LOW QUALITY PROTEIN: talanin n=1 Tax=Trichechus manatus latirostris TaxID=127582 RepID=A0A2Y9RS44_TRIMA|nr:LOW QUALITY PROTEIN: talanin [Trichechus manatus latirostris]